MLCPYVQSIGRFVLALVSALVAGFVWLHLSDDPIFYRQDRAPGMLRNAVLELEYRVINSAKAFVMTGQSPAMVHAMFGDPELWWHTHRRAMHIAGQGPDPQDVDEYCEYWGGDYYLQFTFQNGQCRSAMLIDKDILRHAREQRTKSIAKLAIGLSRDQILEQIGCPKFIDSRVDISGLNSSLRNAARLWIYDDFVLSIVDDMCVDAQVLNRETRDAYADWKANQIAKGSTGFSQERIASSFGPPGQRRLGQSVVDSNMPYQPDEEWCYDTGFSSAVELQFKNNVCSTAQICDIFH